MSVLETPRIYFRGQISWDPVTTNNFAPSSRVAAYDEDNVDATYKAVPVQTEQVDAFRSGAIDEVPVDPSDDLSSWNPHGTYRSNLFSTAVCGVDIGKGLDTTDPFVSAPVGLAGMLIDAEPYGPYTSQLFFDAMSFGIAGGCRVLGKRKRRFDDRNINFFANPSNNIIAGTASVTWQAVFDKAGGLEIDDLDSPALRALRAALSSDDVLGLMVRWNSYRTVYFNDPKQSNGSQEQTDDSKLLMEKLRMGGFQPNPARSLVVGALGLWRRGDCPTEPGERTLVSTLATIPGQKAPADRGPAIGTAFMRLDMVSTPPTLTLDLSNSIPAANRATDKFDLGTLTIVAADPPPAVALAEVATIAFSDYDRAAYEASGGIVTVPLPAGSADLENMVFSIKGPADAPVYLREVRYRALADEPNLYTEEGSIRGLGVQVYDRGRPAGSGHTVTWSLLQPSKSTDATHWQATTDANGRVQLPVDTSKENIYAYILQVGAKPVLPVTEDGFNPLLFAYAYIRVLPIDADLARLEPSWDNVHRHVLAGFQAIAPCMDNWLRLGDRDQVWAYGKLIKRLTDPAAFEEYRYMPATRDLTAGQRALLYNFLDAGSPAQAVPGDMLLKAAPEVEAPAPQPLAGIELPDMPRIAGSHRGGGKKAS